MARLSLLLFGRPSLSLNGDSVSLPCPPKAMALLALLAVDAAHPQPRGVLAGMLWPGYTERSARANLSNTLWVLRQLCDEDAATPEPERCLLAGRNVVQLHSDVCATDVAAFDALISTHRRHKHTDVLGCATCAEVLAQALALYRGDLLTDFGLDDSPEFEEWVVRQRERYRREALATVRLLALGALQGARLESASEYVRRWLEIDPLDEEAHRTMMSSLAQRGQRSAALAQFALCRQVLREELGLSPDAETSALAERIGAQLLGPPDLKAAELLAQSPPFINRPESFSAPVFVARRDELRQLMGLLERTLTGEPQVAFVRGEAGSGKTLLLEEFARRAMAHCVQLVAVTGRCDAAVGGGDPYLAFREALEQLTGDVASRWQAGSMSSTQASRLWALMPVAGQALAQVAPDLLGSLLSLTPLLQRSMAAAAPGAAWLDALSGAIVARQRATAQVSQAALFVQYAALLTRLADRAPLLLMLDDLQWADSGTVGLLYHLATRLHSAPVLIVGAYRPEEMETAQAPHQERWSQPLGAVLYEIRRRRGDIEVDLNRADGRGFVAALVASSPNHLSQAFSEALYQWTGGNALFAAEVWRELQEHGVLSQDKDGYWHETGVPWGALPARVEGAIAARVARLSPGLQGALRLASAEGEVFTAEALAEVQGLSPAALVRELSAEGDRRHHLIAALQEPAQGLCVYRFRHILVRDQLYSTLDAAERRYAHLQLGQTLERLHQNDLDEAALRLARHFELAGVNDKAARYLERAGDHAVRLGAYHEADMAYRRAIELVRALGSHSEGLRYELQLQSQVCYTTHSIRGMGAEECRVTFERTCALARQLGDAAMVAFALRMLNTYHCTVGAFDEALQCSDELTALARAAADDELLASASAFAGWVHVWLGDFVRAKEEQRGIVSRVYAGLDPGPSVLRPLFYAGIMGYEAMVRLALGFPEQAEECLVLGMARARRFGAIEMVCQNHAYRAHLAIMRHDPPATARAAGVVAHLATEHGFAMFAMLSQLYQGWARAWMGEPEAGVMQIREAMVESERQCDLSFMPMMECLLGEALGLSGQAQLGLEAVARGLELEDELGERMFRCELFGVRGDLLLQLHPADREGAERAYLTALETARSQQALYFELRACLRLARLQHGTPPAAAALRLLQGVYERFTEGFDAPDLVLAQELLSGQGRCAR